MVGRIGVVLKAHERKEKQTKNLIKLEQCRYFPDPEVRASIASSSSSSREMFLGDKPKKGKEKEIGTRRKRK